jgi:RNA polymerase sigma factor (sigma-70 family)
MDDDAALVRAACEGSKQAFADIYDRYSDRLFGFLCSVMRNREDAADALQDTFVAAASRMHQLRDPTKLRPWLFAIARHTALRSLGRSSRQEPIEELEVTDTAAGPAELAKQAELAELIEAVAEGLNPRDRVVLGLHLREGLEGQELGAAIGVSAGHADVLMSRLRDQVERSLGALLVARMGRKDCTKLQSVLSDWDGRFTATWRKRVARHVDQCSVCGELRKRAVSPVSLLSALPVIKAPAALRTKVLEEVQLVGYGRGLDIASVDGETVWPKDGFPPPMIGSRKKKGVAAALAVAACLSIGLSVPMFAGRQEPIAAAPSPVPLAFNQKILQIPLVFNKDVVLAAPPGEPSPPVESSPPPAQTPNGNLKLPSPKPTGTPGPSASPDPLVVVDPADEPSPLPAADSSPPTLGSLRVNPGRISATGDCGGANPSTAQISIISSDPSGIDGVTLSYSGPRPGSVKMSKAGTTYSATVGPFAQASVPRSGSVSIPLTITSTDGAGNQASRTGTLELVCDRGASDGFTVITPTTSLPPRPAG